MSHGGLKRARSWKRRIQPKEAYSSPGLLYSESCDMAGFRQRQTSVQSSDAEKNLLDGLCASRSAGGFPATVLVGSWRDGSHTLHRLVGRLP